MIRFNPDKYTRDGKTVESPFKYTKKRQLPTIVREILDMRLTKLGETIDFYSDENTHLDSIFTEVKLFYD